MILLLIIVAYFLGFLTAAILAAASRADDWSRSDWPERKTENTP